MMKDIIVDFSGWVRITPWKVVFVCIGSDKPDITGEQWLALYKDAQSDYIRSNVISVQRDCEDGNYEYIDVFEDDTPDGYATPKTIYLKRADSALKELTDDNVEWTFDGEKFINIRRGK